MQFLFGPLIDLGSFLANWMRGILRLHLTPDWSVIGFFAILCLICFWSAAIASQIAESRGRAPGIHYWLGFIIPGLYPLAIAPFLKPTFGENAAPPPPPPPSPPKVRPGGFQYAESQESAAGPTTHAPETQLDPNALITATYLMEIARNPDGTAAGPFVFTLTDGTEAEVIRIQNILDAVAVLELPGLKPGSGLRVLRLPYERIKKIQYKF